MELTNERDHILWDAKKGDYCSEWSWANGVVRFSKVDQVYIQRNSFLPRQLLQPTNRKHHTVGRMVQSKTTMFLWQDPHALAVLTEAVSGSLHRHLAVVCYQRDTPALQLPHSGLSFFLWSAVKPASFHCCGTSHLSPMDYNELVYQSYLLQRCNPACGH